MLHSIHRLSQRCAPYLLRKNIYLFHTTFQKYNKKVQQENFQQTDETKQENFQQTTKKYNKRILKIAGASILLFIGFCELMYLICEWKWLVLTTKIDPEGSLHDMILKIIKGRPYRNYITTKGGRLIHLKSEPNGVFLPTDMLVCWIDGSLISLVSFGYSRLFYSTRITNSWKITNENGGWSFCMLKK